jgi:leucyl aminopeptidase
MHIKISGAREKLPKQYVLVVLVSKGTEHFVDSANGKVLQVPSGKLGKVTPRTFRTLIRTVVQAAKKHKLSHIAVPLAYADFPKCAAYGETWFWSTVAENLLIADYEYTTYKSKKSKYALNEVRIVTEAGKAARDGVARGSIVGSYVNQCRDLANTPGGDMTPRVLGAYAQAILKGPKTKVSVLDEKAILKLKMGGLLGVGMGAKDKPRFIVIEYRGGKKDAAPVVFVGKGITFDTGGLQVKPGMAMYEMHMDMSGGASVVAAIGAIQKLGLKKNVIGLIPAAENAVSDGSMRPGDVLTMMSGTTVDVLHTDAEGRLVLADALHYARRYSPKLVVDVATLTGAALVAMGTHAHAIMTKKRSLEDRFRELGEESGDYTFPLPLWDEYKQYTKGVHGDLANIAPGDSRYGGSINGGMFLSHFTKGMPWVHIDMAPRMTSVPSDKLAKGATGEPVRLLIKIAENF